MAFSSVIVGILVVAAGAANFEGRLRSGDIVYSPNAMNGARSLLLDHPASFDAGIALPVTPQAAKTILGQSSGGAKDKAKGDHNEDGHSDNGQQKDNDNQNDKGDHNNDAHPDNGHRNDTRDSELIRNHEFTQGLSDWESKGAYVASSFGPIAPSEMSRDNTFAVAHTGYGDASNLGFLSQSITVPMARNAAFSILYNFVTTEYPTWVGSDYNDYFQVTLSGPSGEKTLSMAEFLNSASLSAVSGLPGVLEPWDLSGPVAGGQTGWKLFNLSALPLKQGIYNVRVSVHDVGDNIVDSAILVDRVSLK